MVKKLHYLKNNVKTTNSYLIKLNYWHLVHTACLATSSVKNKALHYMTRYCRCDLEWQNLTGMLSFVYSFKIVEYSRVHNPWSSRIWRLYSLYIYY